MRSWVVLALFACAMISARADDPPGYPRALIGHVKAVIHQGVIVEGVGESQLHPMPSPGIDHECFAGVGGLILVHNLEGNYQPGQQIEIMVARQTATFTYSPDPSHSYQLDTCYVLSTRLAFPVEIAWDPSAPASSSPSLPASSSAPGSSGDVHLAPASSPNWSPGSMNDPVPGARPGSP